MGLRLITRRNSKGQVCVGAPCWGKMRAFVGSVWLVAPTSRLPKKNISQTAQKVMAAADKISQAIEINSARLPNLRIQSQILDFID